MHWFIDKHVEGKRKICIIKVDSLQSAWLIDWFSRFDTLECVLIATATLDDVICWFVSWNDLKIVELRCMFSRNKVGLYNKSH